MNNKNVFSENLKRYMKENDKSRREVCEALGVSYYTFSDWVNGKKYPRMDKVEKIANYFGILKSDLIEDKQKQPPQGELSFKKREFIKRVERMSEAQLERLEQILALVEKTDEWVIQIARLSVFQCGQWFVVSCPCGLNILSYYERMFVYVKNYNNLELKNQCPSLVFMYANLE